ncbi:hypothetical protein SARC_07017 [Sphaeroforma arctica JP610]|uniref:Uncharacterized protein n=1 Tax=Sphaeroforma arctica JP610 TaxID=667725 RepID=A0A0L0FVQ7_9EUKA|nr:hypothetical protein SARC_07017 [Sphaeroforma arctica JP610]KNC80626.1 hypothetical protein SARC_07017 [Sphaeroforma arctica JP610]|eukprot:XP_014154528.1 hypothetical protein SARC_07017 [Sphaeroforma arctica JP610]
MMPLAHYSDRMISRDKVEAIKEREKHVPETILASDVKERRTRLPKGYPSVHDADYAAKCAKYHGSVRTRVEEYEYPSQQKAATQFCKINPVTLDNVIH